MYSLAPGPHSFVSVYNIASLPPQVLFGDDGYLKLADFGLGVALDKPAQRLKDVCGSLLYVRHRRRHRLHCDEQTSLTQP